MSPTPGRAKVIPMRLLGRSIEPLMLMASAVPLTGVTLIVWVKLAVLAEIALARAPSISEVSWAEFPPPEALGFVVATWPLLQPARTTPTPTTAAAIRNLNMCRFRIAAAVVGVGVVLAGCSKGQVATTNP